MPQLWFLSPAQDGSTLLLFAPSVLFMFEATELLHNKYPKPACTLLPTPTFLPLASQLCHFQSCPLYLGQPVSPAPSNLPVSDPSLLSETFYRGLTAKVPPSRHPTLRIWRGRSNSRTEIKCQFQLTWARHTFTRCFRSCLLGQMRINKKK